MKELSVILGSAGVLLVVVGLVGGNFKFSGSTMPAVGKWARIPCFLVGGFLVVLAVGLVVQDAADPSIQTTTITGPITTTPTPTPTATEVLGVVSGEDGFGNVYSSPSTIDWIGVLPNGTVLRITCTTRGESVIRSDGVGSTLWDWVTDGTGIAFIPDVYLDTGTADATMPDCASV